MSTACPRLGFTLRPPPDAPDVTRDLAAALDALGLEAASDGARIVVTRTGSQTTEGDREAVRARWPDAELGPLVDLGA